MPASLHGHDSKQLLPTYNQRSGVLSRLRELGRSQMRGILTAARPLPGPAIAGSVLSTSKLLWISGIWPVVLAQAEACVSHHPASLPCASLLQGGAPQTRNDAMVEEVRRFAQEIKAFRAEYLGLCRDTERTCAQVQTLAQRTPGRPCSTRIVCSYADAQGPDIWQDQGAAHVLRKNTGTLLCFLCRPYASGHHNARQAPTSYLQQQRGVWSSAHGGHPPHCECL